MFQGGATRLGLAEYTMSRSASHSAARAETAALGASTRPSARTRIDARRIPACRFVRQTRTSSPRRRECHCAKTSPARRCQRHHPLLKRHRPRPIPYPARRHRNPQNTPGAVRPCIAASHPLDPASGFTARWYWRLRPRRWSIPPGVMNGPHDALPGPHCSHVRCEHVAGVVVHVRPLSRHLSPTPLYADV